MNGKVNRTNGGNCAIKGIVEEAKAKGIVKAGDFVKLINTAGTSEIKENPIQGTFSYGIKGVALSENKVFLLFGHNQNALKAVICDINDKEILMGEVYTIQSGSYAGSYNTFDIVKLTENKVFIRYNYYNNGFLANGTICTISGRNISIGTRTQISSTKESGRNGGMVALSESKVLNILNEYGALYAVICNITDTEIQVGTKVATGLASYTNFMTSLGITALNENKVFISCLDASVYYMRGVILDIIEDIITVGAVTQISNRKASDNPSEENKTSIIKILPNKVLILWEERSSSTTNYTTNLYGCVCDIDKLVINVGNTVELYAGQSKVVLFSGILILENIVQIMYSNYNKLAKMVCSINELEITIISNDTTNDDIQYVHQTLCTFLLNPSKILIMYMNLGNKEVYFIENSETSIKTLENKYDIIYGIAKTSATDGQPVQVITPNYESEVN